MKIIFTNISKKELDLKKEQIFIGISLGVLKPLTEKIAKEYIRFALNKTNKKVVILIADQISKYNYEVFSSYSKGKAEKRAIREGKKISDFFKNILKKFTLEEKNKIKILRWRDIWDSRKEKIRLLLEEEYISNGIFRKRINFFLEEYAKTRGRKLNIKQKELLSNYLLYELPTLLDGISYREEKYNLLFYPSFKKSSMSSFVKEIYEGRKFPKLTKKLKLSKKIGILESTIK